MAEKKKTAPAAKKTKKDYRIEKKRSGRYMVLTPDGKYIRGLPKLEILVKEGLVKTGLPKKKEEAPAAEPTPAT